MGTRKAVVLVGLVVAFVTAFVLSAGSASATLIGPGGGEAVACKLSGSTYSSLTGTAVVKLPCIGNVVTFSAWIPGSSHYTCAAVGYTPYVYKSGASTAWWDNGDRAECADGNTYQSTYWPGPTPPQFSNVTLGAEMDIYGASHDNPANYVITVYKQ
jgi:hypothetical protein